MNNLKEYVHQDTNTLYITLYVTLYDVNTLPLLTIATEAYPNGQAIVEQSRANESVPAAMRSLVEP